MGILGSQTELACDLLSSRLHHTPEDFRSLHPILMHLLYCALVLYIYMCSIAMYVWVFLGSVCLYVCCHKRPARVRWIERERGYVECAVGRPSCLLHSDLLLLPRICIVYVYVYIGYVYVEEV